MGNIGGMGGMFKIGPPEDSECLLDLFAFVLYRVRDDQSPFIVQPGTLLVWKDSGLAPGIEDLKAGLQCKAGPPQTRWPALIVEKDTWRELQGGPFLKAVQASIEAAPYFGVYTGKEICRLLAAVAQTKGSAEPEFKDHNLRVYKERIEGALKTYTQAQHQGAVETFQANQRFPPEAQSQQAVSAPPQSQAPPVQPKPTSPPPAPPILIRPRVERPQLWPTERDQFTRGFISTELISLWHASHVGPSYAEKGENQDATFACTDGSRVFFALADGVSTSYGARFSAVAIVNIFCSTLQELLKSATEPTPSLLKEAANKTRIWLDDTLSFLVTNPNASEWAQVRGASNINDDVALHLCENTQTLANRFWGPVMAATLVGGVVQPSANGRGLEVFALRVGDGLIERIENLDTEGGISSLLAMDSQETEISASLSPGRLGENSLVSPETILPSIGAGELLLVSSDGLTRGHNGSVSQKLREITGSSRIGLHNDDQSAALTILQKAADQADDSFKENQQIHLFNDNLSLIVITSKLGKRRGGGVG